LFFAALATGNMMKTSETLAKNPRRARRHRMFGNLGGIIGCWPRLTSWRAKGMFTDLVRKYPDFMPAKINLARANQMLAIEPPRADQILLEVPNKLSTAEPAPSMMVSGDVQSNWLPGCGAQLPEKAHNAVRTRPDHGPPGRPYIRGGNLAKALDRGGPKRGADARSTDIQSQERRLTALGQKKDARTTHTSKF